MEGPVYWSESFRIECQEYYTPDVWSFVRVINIWRICVCLWFQTYFVQFWVLEHRLGKYFRCFTISLIFLQKCIASFLNLYSDSCTRIATTQAIFGLDWVIHADLVLIAGKIINFGSLGWMLNSGYVCIVVDQKIIFLSLDIYTCTLEIIIFSIFASDILFGFFGDVGVLLITGV